jgi:hypothetical protein
MIRRNKLTTFFNSIYPPMKRISQYGTHLNFRARLSITNLDIEIKQVTIIFTSVSLIVSQYFTNILTHKSSFGYQRLSTNCPTCKIYATFYFRRFFWAQLVSVTAYRPKRTLYWIALSVVTYLSSKGYIGSKRSSYIELRIITIRQLHLYH